MSEERRYALGSLFGPVTIDMIGTPQARRLRMKVLEVGPGMALLTMPYHEEIVGDPVRGVVFGGAITTLLDQASGLCVACSLEQLIAIATIDLRVDYLRAAEPRHDLFARTECYRVTRNVAFVRGSAWEKDPADPFATSHGTFMLGANRSEVYLGKFTRSSE